MAEQGYIKVVGAKEHNLKDVSIDIPRGKFVVITGLSGSGKSSLAFDTIYAEGQRRYVESLSAYARQFLQMQDKPDVESITGLSPAIAIDQKTTSKNPRSTVATVTEVYDYLRLLFARTGVPYSPATGLPIQRQSVSQMVDRIMQLPDGTKVYLLSPVIRGAKGEHKKELDSLRKGGYSRVRIDGMVYEMEDLPQLDKNKKHNIEAVVDRLVISESLGNRLPDSIETALRLSNGLLYIEIVGLPDGKEVAEFKNANLLTTEVKGAKDSALEKDSVATGSVIIFSEHFSCPVSGFSIPEIEPRLFSFNSPYGACPTCDGMGTDMFFDPDLIVPDKMLSLEEGAIAPWASSQSKYYSQLLAALAAHYKFRLGTPFKRLSKEVQQVILYGSGTEIIDVEYRDDFRTHRTRKPFEGVIPNMERRYRETDSAWVREEFAKYQNITSCPACGGYRLNKEALCVKLAGKHIGEVTDMTIEDAAAWIDELPDHMNDTQRKISERVLQELARRIGFLNNVGLEYLALSRNSGTLSGGEAQRIRLASQIGAGLSGVLYVLDEPSIGLHQCDNDKLLTTLQNLRDLGNTVLVVEHDEDTMRAADYLIDIGVGAGIRGGEIIAHGTPKQVMKSTKSITAAYLSGKKQIEIPQRRKADSKRVITIRGARANNLKNITVSFPLGMFCAVTGVSGGGKSSLVIHTLYKAVTKILNNNKNIPGPYDSIEGLEYIDKIIEIDQSPIGRTPRSNPATYTGAFSPIRDLFAATAESKARGYKGGRFSFNVKGGRCETCQGDGMLKIEMHFLPDIYVTCDACHGKRYNRETLEVTYKGKSIADVLEMTVDDACEFFTHISVVHDKVKALQEVGLGYIRLGQSATTLSGGEAQRIKLARELSKRSTGRTLYILDEPTTGLHTHDISRLLHVLHRLVDGGNTVVVIEHNLEVIKTADHIIDIGPKGGAKGGEIVATGTPEDICTNERSITGQYLSPYLRKNQAA